MKLRSLLAPVLVAGSMALAQPAHAELLSYYRFDSGNLLGSTGGSQGGTITTDFAAGATGYTNLTGAGSGTNNNRAAGDGVDSSTSALGLLGNGNNGKYLQFQVNTTGNSNVIFSWATRSAAFTSETLAYSTDGTNFTNASTISPPGTYGSTVQSYSFGTNPAVTNQSNLFFRLIFNGAPNSGTTTTRIDNVRIEAFPTPEPSTWAMMGLGLGAVVMVARRRKRGEQQMAASALAI